MQTSMPQDPRWYVISLRPRGGHAALRRAAARAGLGFVALSPWRIEARDDAATRARLAAALAADAVVFTSPVAVATARRLAGLPPALPAVAVGAGTALALRRAGVARVAHPERMDSEGLLALPALRDPAGRRVGLVTAPGGRGLIEPTLRERGAEVVRADIYRRAPCPPPAAAVERLHAIDAPLALALSSGEALEHLLAQLGDDALARLRRARVLAASDRLADLARAHGFDDVVRAEGPRPAQLVAALAA